MVCCSPYQRGSRAGSRSVTFHCRQSCASCRISVMACRRRACTLWPCDQSEAGRDLNDHPSTLSGGYGLTWTSLLCLPAGWNGESSHIFVCVPVCSRLADAGTHNSRTAQLQARNVHTRTHMHPYRHIHTSHTDACRTWYLGINTQAPPSNLKLHLPPPSTGVSLTCMVHKAWAMLSHGQVNVRSTKQGTLVPHALRYAPGLVNVFAPLPCPRLWPYPCPCPACLWGRRIPYPGYTLAGQSRSTRPGSTCSTRY